MSTWICVIFAWYNCACKNKYLPRKQSGVELTSPVKKVALYFGEGGMARSPGGLGRIVAFLEVHVHTTGFPGLSVNVGADKNASTYKSKKITVTYRSKPKSHSKSKNDLLDISEDDNGPPRSENQNSGSGSVFSINLRGRVNHRDCWNDSLGLGKRDRGHNHLYFIGPVVLRAGGGAAVVPVVLRAAPRPRLRPTESRGGSITGDGQPRMRGFKCLPYTNAALSIRRRPRMSLSLRWAWT
nr:uncharacterized protein LOC113827267 [Penaeus vannamei]